MQQPDVEIKEKPEFDGKVVMDKTIKEQRVVVVDHADRTAMYVNGVEFDYQEGQSLQEYIFQGRVLLQQRKLRKV